MVGVRMKGLWVIVLLSFCTTSTLYQVPDIDLPQQLKMNEQEQQLRQKAPLFIATSSKTVT